MRYVPFFFLLLVCLCFPVMATSPEVIPDGSITPTLSAVPVPSDPSDPVEVSPLQASYLQGGFYFDCSTSLGALRLYVPSEWASDRLALTSGGAPFNLSTSTLYLYCPDRPDLEFFARRFSEISYRDRNEHDRPLSVTSISSSNIDFMSDSVPRPSEYHLLLILAFSVFCLLLFKVIFRW